MIKDKTKIEIEPFFHLHEFDMPRLKFHRIMCHPMQEIKIPYPMSRYNKFDNYISMN